MAKHAKKLLENEPDLPGSPEDPDMHARTLDPAPADQDNEPKEAVQLDVSISDNDACLVMTDVLGGSGDAKARSTRILARFASEGWCIVKGPQE